MDSAVTSSSRGLIGLVHDGHAVIVSGMYTLSRCSSCGSNAIESEGVRLNGRKQRALKEF